MKNVIFLISVASIVSCATKNNSTIGYLQGNEVSWNGSYYTILHYGYPNIYRLQLMEMISEKWKIKHKSASDCVIDMKLISDIDRKNKKTYDAIEKKYGSDWKVRYEKDIDEAATKQVDIMDVMIINKPFREQLKKCDIEIDGVDKKIKLLNNSEVYEVAVYGYNHKGEKLDCCTLHVDTKNRKVNIIK
ncbi:hypothetical protein [Chryseobacterium sp. JK1]|uniref:FEKKY domain-containing protein n=1 Tax=Chryseobacterium sp. JK1 TaxID=874294 RepID=UPI003D69265D